jgi:choline dehydrogenase
MRTAISRRRFLAGAVALPMVRTGVGRQSPGEAEADVVVIGGDPAALAAVYRLSETPGIRVLLIDDVPAWAPPPAAPPALIADLPPFVRGHQVCFNGWRDLGNAGWGYADVLPSFMRLEKYEAGANAHRGGTGPVPVAHCWDPHPGHRAFLLACNSGGFAQDSRHDFNGPRSQSVGGYYQKAIADDKPVDLAAVLVAPARGRGAVAVVPRAQATRIVFEGRRAVGVEYLRGSERAVVRATRAVVLGATPVRAAQVLMLSGVGPAEPLRQLGLAIVADRPGVGANLHDQVWLPLRWRALPPAEALAESSVTAGLFTVSLVASPPDLQMDFVDPRRAGAPLVGLDITNVQPTSRGRVTLRSTNPQDSPEVALDALATEADVTALVQGVRLARLIGASPQLDRFRGDETADSAAARSTPELQAYVRSVAARRRHLAGTCKMGPSSDAVAVVDARLAVHGVEGLYVAGTSVMPVVVNAPPDAAALMIGDRAGEFVFAAIRP